MTAVKAWWAAVSGIVAPGAAYLVAIAQTKGHIDGTDWVIGVLICIGGGAVTGGVTYLAPPNLPKETVDPEVPTLNA
jgi:hypothetical protein